MALKRLQREWTEKPNDYPGAIGELSNSAGFYPVPNGNAANPIDGQLLNRVASNIPASFIQVPTPYGIALGIRDGGTGNEYLEALTGGVDRRNFTLISKLRATASSGAGVGMRTSGNDILLWRSSGTFDLRIGGTDYIAGGTFNLNQFYDYSVRSNAGGVAVRVDKTDVISGGVAAAGNMPSILNVGVDALGGGNIYGDYLYCFIVPGYLTEQQIDDIHDNWLSYLRPRTIYYPVVAGGASVAPSDITQTQTIDGVTLTQHNVLAVNSVSQSQALDPSVVAAKYSITPNSAMQTQLLDVAALIQHGAITAQDLAQSQTLAPVSLVVVGTLAINGATQGQSLDVVVLTQHQNLSPNNVAQPQSLDVAALSLGGEAIVVASVSQAQALGAALLTQHGVLVVSDVVQQQIIGAVNFNNDVGWIEGELVLVSMVDGRLTIAPTVDGKITFN